MATSKAISVEILRHLADDLEEASKHSKVFDSSSSQTWQERLDVVLEGIHETDSIGRLQESVHAAYSAHKSRKGSMARLTKQAAFDCRALASSIEEHLTEDEGEQEFWVYSDDAKEAFDADELKRLTTTMCAENDLEVFTREDMENMIQSNMDEEREECNIDGVLYPLGLILRRCNPDAFRDMVDEYSNDESIFMRVTG